MCHINSLKSTLQFCYEASFDIVYLLQFLSTNTSCVYITQQEHYIYSKEGNPENRPEILLCATYNK